MDDSNNHEVARIRHFSGVKRACRAGQWIVIPAAFFILVEWAVRDAERRETLPMSWDWPRVEVFKGRIDLVLLGSSRVAAAVDTQLFEREMSHHVGHPVGALNLGHGWSYLIQNYLYLRRLVGRRPGILQGATVLIELPGGQLDFDGQRWDGRWFDPDFAHQLVGLLETDDLRRLWAARMPFEDKMSMTFGFAAQRSSLVARRAAIGRCIMDHVKREAAAVPWPFTKRTGRRAASADIAATAGIRTGEADVRRARRLAIELSKKKSVFEPVARREDLVIEDLARLLRTAGAHLVFFEMPLHSVQSARHRSAEWHAMREEFATRATDWDAIFLRPDFRTTDDDFPDMWHLRRSKSPEFTAILAHSCAEKLLEMASRTADEAVSVWHLDHSGIQHR